MKLFKVCFLIFMKQYLKKPSYLICLIMLPIIIICISLFSGIKNDDQFSVGLYKEQNGEYETKVIDKLLKNNNEINFILFDDKEQLKTSVLKNEIICGYVFHSNFSDEIEQNGSDIITIIKTPNSYYDIFAKEILYSAIYEELSSYIAHNFLQEREINSTRQSLNTQIKKYSSSKDMIRINIETIEQQSTESNQKVIYLNVTKGVISIFIFLLAMLTCVYIADDFSGNAIGSIAKKLNAPFLQLYCIAPSLFCTIIIGIGSILLSYSLYSEYMNNILYELIYLIIYILTVFNIAFVISNYMKSSIILSFIPFFMIGLIIFTPMIFDITTYLPQIKPFVNFLPSYQYVTLNNDINMLLYMLIVNIIFLLLYIVKLKKFKHLV